MTPEKINETRIQSGVSALQNMLNMAVQTGINYASDLAVCKAELAECQTELAEANEKIAAHDNAGT